MAANMDQSLIAKVEIEDLSLDFSLTTESSEVEDSVNLELQNNKCDITPVSPMAVSDGTNPTLTMKVNSEEYYYNVIKPRCPNLEYSYSELFSDKMKEPGFIKEFVAKRIATALDKVKKSQSLLTLNESQDKNVLDKGFVNTSNLQRSLECLNETFSKNLGSTFNTSLPKENDTFVATKCHKLRKSFSFSGISNLNKDESLIDMEMELEDSVPSEDERDEMGLPVRKFLFCGTPQKKKHDITETIQKYKKILRESFGEPCDDVNNFVEEEAVPAPTYVNQPASSLLSDVQDVHLKKTTSKAAGAKGPMKALMPLQNMTKHVSAILSSPFKKKKVKMVNVTNKDSSHISDDSFNFLDSHPVAVSTPTSGSRESRNETISSKNRSFQRSFSEERVSNKASDITQTISHIKSTSQLSTANNTRTINNTEKTSTKSAAINSVRQSIVSTSKTVRSAGLKRPSTAPVSIKAPLTAKLPTNINQNSKLGEIAKPLTSKLNTIRNVATSQSVSNTTRTMKLSGSSDKKTLFMPKLRKPSSHTNKENK